MIDRKSIRYLNETFVFVHEVKKKLQMVIGGLLTAFFMVGIIGILLGQIEMRHIPVYFVFMIPSFLLLWCGIKTGILIEIARRYENIFESYSGETMYIDNLADYLGKSQYKVINELEICLRR